MDTHRLSVTRIVPPMLAVIIGGLAWGSALAQVDAKSVAAAVASPAAQSAGTKSTMVIHVSGTVDSPPESVLLSGNALIRTTAVWDTDLGNPPVVIISISMPGLSGTGFTTQTRYSTDVAVHKVRPLVAADQVEVTVPIIPVSANGWRSARTGLASFALTFDPNSGVLTGASGTIAASTF